MYVTSDRTVFIGDSTNVMSDSTYVMSDSATCHEWQHTTYNHQYYHISSVVCEVHATVVLTTHAQKHFVCRPTGPKPRIWHQHRLWLEMLHRFDTDRWRVTITGDINSDLMCSALCCCGRRRVKTEVWFSSFELNEPEWIDVPPLYDTNAMADAAVMTCPG